MLKVKMYAELIRKENKYKNYRIKSLLDNKFVHIHLGYNCPNIDTSLLLIKYLDMYVGLPSVLHDPDVARRNLYGKAGAFRLCKYGCEYRVLSSEMMKNDKLLNLVWTQVVRAINAYNDCDLLAPEELIVQAINKSDIDVAQDLINRFNIL